MSDKLPSMRRTVLKSLGVGAAATVSGAGLVKARPNNDRFREILLGNLSSPISPDHISDIQEDGLRAHRKSGGTGVVATPITEPPEGAEIVAYSQRMTDNGVPRTYTGIAYSDDYYEGSIKNDISSDEISVEEIQTELHESINSQATVNDRHKKAEDVYQGTDTDSEISLHSSDDFSSDPGWNRINSDTVDSGECPYGVMNNDYVIWQHDETDIVAVGNTLLYYPGEADCDSQWWMDYIELDHGWDSNDTWGDHTSIDRYPVGNETGEVSEPSVSIGYSTAMITFDYSQPSVSRDDRSSGVNGTVGYTWDWNSDHALQGILRAASVCRFDNAPTSTNMIQKHDTDIGFLRGLGSGYVYENFPSTTYIYLN